MKTLLFAGTCCVCATLSGAQAEVGLGRDVLPMCKKALVDPATNWETGVCLGSIKTLVDVGRNGLGPALRFCIPPQAPLASAMGVVVTYVGARPERLNEPFARLAIDAMREAWPCN
jgi:Rap1a immunity proteins